MADAFLKQYGGSGTGSDDCTAKRNQVLAGVTAVTSDSDDEALTGTMPERGKLSRTLSAGESVTLSEGHYAGGTVSAQSLASQTGGATAEDRYVKKGLTYWKDGVLRTGTMETQSAISFSAAALSSTAIRISWKNPAKGPWEGIRVRMSTSGTPGASGGTEKYRGAGSNPNQGGGNNYVDITGLDPSQTYYFTCTSYYTGLPDGSSANVQATTNDKSIREIFAPYSGVQYGRMRGVEDSNVTLYAPITATGDSTFSVGATNRLNVYMPANSILLIYETNQSSTPQNPISDEDLQIIKKYSFKELGINAGGMNFDLGQIKKATLRSILYSSDGLKRHAVELTCEKSFTGFDTAALNNIEFYK